MGARYHLTISCPHCKKVNEDVYFAPTCDLGSHVCCSCGERFWIGDDFKGYEEPVEIDMRKHSMWGKDYTKKTHLPAIQKLE